MQDPHAMVKAQCHSVKKNGSKYDILKKRNIMHRRSLLMFYRIHQLERQDKICQQSLLPLFEKFLPRERVLEALQAERAFEQRERQFNMLTIVYLLLAICLSPNKSIQHVIEAVWHPLRQCFAASLRSTVARFPAASSFTERRYQLTARVLWRLFRTLCR